MMEKAWWQELEVATCIFRKQKEMRQMLMSALSLLVVQPGTTADGTMLCKERLGLNCFDEPN